MATRDSQAGLMSEYLACPELVRAFGFFPPPVDGSGLCGWPWNGSLLWRGRWVAMIQRIALPRRALCVIRTGQDGIDRAPIVAWLSDGPSGRAAHSRGSLVWPPATARSAHRDDLRSQAACLADECGRFWAPYNDCQDAIVLSRQVHYCLKVLALFGRGCRGGRVGGDPDEDHTGGTPREGLARRTNGVRHRHDRSSHRQPLGQRAAGTAAVIQDHRPPEQREIRAGHG